MLSLPPALLRVPRCLLEHPLPLCGSSSTPVGIAGHLTYQSPDERLYSLQLGLVDRWQRHPTSSAAAPSHLSPGFTLESFTLLCALLCLTERRNGVTLTFNQLFRTLTGSRSLCSAHHREALKHTLSTLEALDISALELPSEIPSASSSSISSSPTFERLLTLTPTTTAPVFGQRAPAFILHFSPHFLAALCDPRATTLLNFSSLRSLRSRLARSLFLPLSTWAHYSRASLHNPFRITLSKLISHLGATPPRFLSQRRSFFAGHRKQNILHSLHNLPTPHGFLQVSLTPASSVEDDCLNIWFSEVETELRALPSNTHLRDSSLKNPDMPIVRNFVSSRSAEVTFKEETSDVALKIPSAEGAEAPASILRQNGIQKGLVPFAGSRGSAPASSPSDPLSSFRHLKIYQAWSTSGRSDQDFVSRVRLPSVTLTQDDLSLLHAARISPTRCENFLLLSKKLLPQRTWLDLLGEAKYAALSNTPPKNPTGKLINEILSSVRSAV